MHTHQHGRELSLVLRISLNWFPRQLYAYASTTGGGARCTTTRGRLPTLPPPVAAAGLPPLAAGAARGRSCCRGDRLRLLRVAPSAATTAGEEEIPAEDAATAR